MPPAYVKPYVKRQRNDATDAEAICEAVTRPTCGSCRAEDIMASGHAYRAKGRTHGRSDQCCKVKILLANPEPMVWTPPSGRGVISNVNA